MNVCVLESQASLTRRTLRAKLCTFRVSRKHCSVRSDDVTCTSLRPVLAVSIFENYRTPVLHPFTTRFCWLTSSTVASRGTVSFQPASLKLYADAFLSREKDTLR